MTTPYVYLIGWTKLDKWYIGCRYAEKCNPSDLWKSYFTSSDYVKAFRQENGEPDSFQILKECKDYKEALSFEEEKQREFDVLNDDRWLNRNINGTFYFSFKGRKHSNKAKQKIKERKYYTNLETHEVKTFGPLDSVPDGWIKGNWNPKTIQKIKEKAMGRKHSEDTKRKMSETHKGKTFSEESKLKMSIAKRQMTEETKEKIAASKRGRKLSEETKQKLREKSILARKNKQWSTKKLSSQEKVIGESI